jgi:hypothetical protein
MTTITDKGFDAISGQLVSGTDGQIDAIALGSGSGSESTTATSLANEAVRIAGSNNNVDLIDSSPAGEGELTIRVKGGTEVPAGTQIRELGAFIGGAGGGGDLAVIDNFSAKTVEAGDTEEFVLPIGFARV